MHDDLSEQLTRASTHLDAGFDAARVEHALSGLERRIERRRTVKRTGTALALVAVVLVGFFSLRNEAAAPLAQRGDVLTQDGSLASALEPDTQLQVQHDGDSEVELSLERGAGHFDVSKRPARRYRVRAGSVDVQVLGTIFDVKRRGARSEVSVTRGAVQVSWPGGQTVLHAGDHGWFPPALEEVAPVAAATPEQTADSQVVTPTPALPPEPALESPLVRHDAWRALARAGKHGEAFRSLDRVHSAQVEDLEGLLLAADAARLSAHPREAAHYLERLVKRYPRTAPARLAAFTLGGLQLHELSDPGRAARSFERAYRLDPSGPLAEDALARQAEALQRAGRADRAAQVARQYLARYPKGARRAELTRFLADE